MKMPNALPLVALAGVLLLAQGVQAGPTSDQKLIDKYAAGLGADNSISQITAVSQLNDVNPTDWAFQSLKSLVERYGCIEGYPNKTFLGNKATTRYEFAAGLNACLEKVNELITAANSDKVTKEDLATLTKLQEEFATELATLRGRTDALEAKVKELESQQFSTTTKLDGTLVVNLVGAGASQSVATNPFSAPGLTPDATVSGSASNVSMTSRVTLNLRTSFTGKDQLRVRIRGFAGQDTSGVFSAGTGVGTLFNSGTNGTTNGVSGANIDKLYYTTTVFGDAVRYWVGPRLQTIDIVDGNSFAGGDDVNSFGTVMHSYSPLISGAVQNGPGLGLDWTIAPWVSLRGLYIAGDGGASGGGAGAAGLFGGTTKGVAELEFKPVKNVAVRLQYARMSIQRTTSGTVFGGPTNALLVGTDPTFAALGAAATVNSAQTDAYGVNAEWALTPAIGLFGRYATGTTTFNGISSTLNTNTYHVGVTVQDAFVRGNLFGVAYGQPIRITGGPVTDSGTEGDVEAFYAIQLYDRFTLTPSVQFYFTPGNVSGNPTVTVGVIRGSFSF